MSSGTGGTLYSTDSDGNPNVFEVDNDNDERWLNSNYGIADFVWFAVDQWVFVRPRKSHHFSPALLGEFCFRIDPFQPPSILPISAIFRESVIYFLLSRDFVSQRIRRKILRVSSFLMAKRLEKSAQHTELNNKQFLKNIEPTIKNPEEVWPDYSDKNRKSMLL